MPRVFFPVAFSRQPGPSPGTKTSGCDLGTARPPPAVSLWIPLVQSQRRRSSFARIFGRNSLEPQPCPNASTSTTRIARQSVKRLVNYSGSVCEQNLHCRYPLLRKLTVFASRTANPPQPFPAYNTRPRPSHTQVDDISRSSLGFGDERLTGGKMTIT